MTDMDPAIEAIAAAFVAAIEEGDIDAIADRIYAPDIVVWHNIDGVEKSSEQSCAMLRWLSATVHPIRYENIVRQPIPGGFVERHTLRGSTPSRPWQTAASPASTNTSTHAPSQCLAPIRSRSDHHRRHVEIDL
jgi:hypothetical protein